MIMQIKAFNTGYWSPPEEEVTKKMMNYYIDFKVQQDYINFYTFGHLKTF